MFYGYDETTPGWQNAKRDELADRLLTLRKQYPDAWSFGHPLVTNDENGVLVRKITTFTDEQRADLVKKADAIFVEVMEVRQ
jgi:hypothetical protein